MPKGRIANAEAGERNMGMDIVSAFNNAFDCSYSVRSWCWLLDIATAYGWKPAGIILERHYIPGDTLDRNCPANDELQREFDGDPDTTAHFQTFEAYCEFRRNGGTIIVGGEDWKGGYGSNEGQFVRPDDARNLSLALSRALDDRLSRRATMARPNDRCPAMKCIRELERRFGVASEGPPTDYASLARLVAEFRDIAAKGGFWIW
jgi:hypothetical protein